MTILTATIELSDMTDTPSFVTPQIQNRGNFSFQGKIFIHFEGTINRTLQKNCDYCVTNHMVIST